MSVGRVNDDLEAILSIEVMGSNGKAVSIETVVDTGFNGFLTLPPWLIDDLQLPWLYRQQGELADGRFHVFDVHEAQIHWGDNPRAIEVEVADTEPLLGMAILRNQRLSIDVMSGGRVVIESLKEG